MPFITRYTTIRPARTDLDFPIEEVFVVCLRSTSQIESER